jgi:hypothetical protein
VQVQTGLPAVQQRFELAWVFAGHGFVSHAEE